METDQPTIDEQKIQDLRRNGWYTKGDYSHIKQIKINDVEAGIELMFPVNSVVIMTEGIPETIFVPVRAAPKEEVSAV